VATALIRGRDMVLGTHTLPSNARTRTRCSPSRLGRSGDRVVNTPCNWRFGSFRGRVRSTSRRARCSQVSTSRSSPTRRPFRPGHTCGSSTSCARGASSSPWRGASAGSRNGDRTKPITCSSRRSSSFIARHHGEPRRRRRWSRCCLGPARRRAPRGPGVSRPMSRCGLFGRNGQNIDGKEAAT
jgi:hypothetical protein